MGKCKWESNFYLLVIEKPIFSYYKCVEAKKNAIKKSFAKNPNKGPTIYSKYSNKNVNFI